MSKRKKTFAREFEQLISKHIKVTNIHGVETVTLTEQGFDIARRALLQRCASKQVANIIKCTKSLTSLRRFAKIV